MRGKKNTHTPTLSFLIACSNPDQQVNGRGNVRWRLRSFGDVPFHRFVSPQPGTRSMMKKTVPCTGVGVLVKTLLFVRYDAEAYLRTGCTLVGSVRLRLRG